VLGGLLIGVMEQLAGGYVSTALIDIFAFIVIIVVLLVRPAGLLGRREVVRV
jgi:branched-chain amino acid transport system permease protein